MQQACIVHHASSIFVSLVVFGEIVYVVEEFAHQQHIVRPLTVAHRCEVGAELIAHGLKFVFVELACHFAHRGPFDLSGLACGNKRGMSELAVHTSKHRIVVIAPYAFCKHAASVKVVDRTFLKIILGASFPGGQ